MKTMNNLPALPSVRKSKEADFGVRFRAWIAENPMPSGTFELKDTRGKDFLPFDEVGEGQIAHALRSKSRKGNLIRVQSGTPGAPDYAYFRQAFAWIVIKYRRGFEIIDIETFLKEKAQSKRKSLTHARAREISTISVK